MDNYKAFGQWNHFSPIGFTATSGWKACAILSPMLIIASPLGPGVGYYFFKETNTTLAVEAGASLSRRIGQR